MSNGVQIPETVPQSAGIFRPMRRIRQQLEKDACEEILTKEWRGVLAVLGDGGYPYTVPLDFCYEDGKIWFHCAKEGHKLDAVKACDKVSFCVIRDDGQEPGEWWHHMSSVVVFGRIALVEDEKEKLEKLCRLGKKYFPTQEHLEKEMSRSAAKAQVLEITVEHMTGKRVREN